MARPTYEGWIAGVAQRGATPPRAAWAYVLRDPRGRREQRADMLPAVVPAEPTLDLKPRGRIKLPMRENVAEWYALLRLLVRCADIEPGMWLRVRTASAEIVDRFAAGSDGSCIDLSVHGGGGGDWQPQIFCALLMLLALTEDDAGGYYSCGAPYSLLLRRQTRPSVDDPEPPGLQVIVERLRVSDRSAYDCARLALR